MFSHLLVPLDGSQLAESVLPVVRTLAHLTGCRITLLHLLEEGAPSQVHGDVHMSGADQAAAYLDTIARRLRAGGLAVTTHVHSVPVGDVARAIAEHASELEQDLIVLCSHGSGSARRFVFGRNAEQVLDHGNTPVLLVQAEDGAPAPAFALRHILTLVDNQAGSEPALRISSQLAGLAHAALVLVAVVPTLSTLAAEQAASGWFVPNTTRHILDLTAEDAAAYLRDQAAHLSSQGIAAGWQVERGDPAPTVVRVAQTVQADLVVLAVRGLAGLGAFWADSVARKVANSYRGALLLVPRAAAPADESNA